MFIVSRAVFTSRLPQQKYAFSNPLSPRFWRVIYVSWYPLDRPREAQIIYQEYGRNAEFST